LLRTLHDVYSSSSYFRLLRFIPLLLITLFGNSLIVVEH
jgi:hypothetical protein